MTPIPDKSLPMLELANAAFELAMRQVVERAERYGTKIILWRDDQIVRLSPDDPSLQKWRRVEPLKKPVDATRMEDGSDS